MGRPHGEQVADKERHCATCSASATTSSGSRRSPAASRGTATRRRWSSAARSTSRRSASSTPPAHGVDLQGCGLLPRRSRPRFPVLAGVRHAREPHAVRRARAHRRAEEPAGHAVAGRRAHAAVRAALAGAGRPDPQAPAVAARRRCRTLRVVSVNLLPDHKAVLEGDREILLTDAARRCGCASTGSTCTCARRASSRRTPRSPRRCTGRRRDVGRRASAPASVWDLYCGVGGFALHVRRPRPRGRRASRPAPRRSRAPTLSAADARADRRALRGRRRHRVRAGRGAAPDLVIVNPPRRGIGEELSRLAGGVRRAARRLLQLQRRSRSPGTSRRCRRCARVARRCSTCSRRPTHYEVLTLLERRASRASCRGPGRVQTAGRRLAIGVPMSTSPCPRRRRRPRRPRRRRRAAADAASRPSSSSGPTPSARPGGGTTTGCTCTPRGGWSGLPGMPIPRRYGRWVARDDVVDYLELYAVHHQLRRAHRASRSRASRGRRRRLGRSSTETAESFDARRRSSSRRGTTTRPCRRRGRASRRSPARSCTPRRTGTPRRTAAGTCSSSASATPAPRSRSTSSRAGRRASGSPSARRRTSCGARTSAGPRRAPGSWCGTCPSRWSTAIAARRRARRGAGPVVVRAAAPDHRPVLARAARARCPLQDVGLIAAVQAGTRRAGRGRGVASTARTSCWPTARGSRPTSCSRPPATAAAWSRWSGDLGVLDDRGLPRRTVRARLGAGPLLHRLHQPDQRHVPRAADRRRAGSPRGDRSRGVVPRLTPAPAPCASAARRPQRPDDEQRLEQQPDRARPVGVEAERVRARDQLGDVAREDRDEERGDHPPTATRCLGRATSAPPSASSTTPGADDDGVGVDAGSTAAPARRNSVAAPAEVAGAGEQQARAERDPADGAGDGGAPRSVSGIGPACHARVHRTAAEPVAQVGGLGVATTSVRTSSVVPVRRRGPAGAPPRCSSTGTRLSSELVDQPRGDDLPGHVGPAHDQHVPVARGRPACVDGARDPVGDEGEVGARHRPRLVRPVRHDEGRHGEGHVAPELDADVVGAPSDHDRSGARALPGGGPRRRRRERRSRRRGTATGAAARRRRPAGSRRRCPAPR